jgi:hypothetical protein
MALTTLAKVKDFMGIKASETTADAILTVLVSQAGRFFLSSVGRQIEQATYTDVFDGDDGFGHTLDQQPVSDYTKITSVLIDDNPITRRTSVGDSGWILVNGRIVLAGYTFSYGVANCSISYQAGYSTVPEDVELAVNVLVADIYKMRDRSGLSSRTLPSGEMATFRPDEIPGFTKWVIDQYKRTAGVAP